MVKKHQINFNKILITLGVIALFLILVASSMKNGTNAKYNSRVDMDSSTRVAKWDVKGITKKNGQNINFEAGFSSKLAEGDEGNWYFHISNYSEVNAKISDNSRIRFRIDNDSYDSSIKDTITWNFMKDPTTNLPLNNPIYFSIEAYDSSVETLIKYQNKTTGTTISYDDYQNLSSTDKEKYDEIISNSVNKIKLFETSQNAFTLTKASEKDKNDKTIYFYYFDINFKDYFTTAYESFLQLGFDNRKTDTTFRVSWKINKVGSQQTTSAERKYNVYSISNNQEPDKPIYGPLNEGTITYYIGATEMNLFDYCLYQHASLTGEPMFTFTNNKGKTYTVQYSYLTDEQKELIRSYVHNSITSLDDLNQLLEYYTYQEYTRYLKEEKEAKENSTYLEYGMKVQIDFIFGVEQID